LPKGRVTQFEIYYGDGTVAGICKSGGTVSHKYKEGKFQAKIVGIINGEKTETMQVMVSFLAPKIYKLQ
jgi:hypothetical protein